MTEIANAYQATVDGLDARAIHIRDFFSRDGAQAPTVPGYEKLVAALPDQWSELYQDFFKTIDQATKIANSQSAFAEETHDTLTKLLRHLAFMQAHPDLKFDSMFPSHWDRAVAAAKSLNSNAEVRSLDNTVFSDRQYLLAVRSGMMSAVDSVIRAAARRFEPVAQTYTENRAELQKIIGPNAIVYTVQFEETGLGRFMRALEIYQEESAPIIEQIRCAQTAEEIPLGAIERYAGLLAMVHEATEAVKQGVSEYEKTALRKSVNTFGAMLSKAQIQTALFQPQTAQRFYPG